jgi:DNA-binding PadR family transcriptional regulator
MSMRHELLHNTEPLSEPVLLILISLAEEPRHGYAILKDVEELSGNRVRMSTGTLYGAIRRLLDNRWIERFREADAPRDRQAYRLTSSGRNVVTEEVRRMKLLTRLATARLADTEG